MNALLVLAFIPLFDNLIYPTLLKLGHPLSAVSRMTIGLILGTLAFACYAILEQAILSDLASLAESLPPLPYSPPTGSPSIVSRISILWQLPQTILMAAGETMFIIAGNKLAYSCAPRELTSVSIALWYLKGFFGTPVSIIFQFHAKL